jgi:hypothetical protein
MRKLFSLLALLGIFSLACGTTTIVTPTIDVNSMVAQTMAAYTVEALLTQGAVPTNTTIETPIPSSPTFTPPPPTSTFTITPEEVAPNPLPVGYTGVILNNGECFNFDSGAVSVPDQRCDLWLVQSGMFRQMNGAKLSGYVTLDPPSRTHCVNGRYEAGDLAVQTDLYMCFITDEGRVGFIVVREYRGNVPFTGIVFDYWVFR